MEDILRRMLAGNQRYTHGRASAWQGPPAAPEAVVLTCACVTDPERVVDVPPGTLLVHQSGGLQPDAAARATVAYGQHLGLDVVLVLGHDPCPLPGSRCGAPETVARVLRAALGHPSLHLFSARLRGGVLELEGAEA